MSRAGHRRERGGFVPCVVCGPWFPLDHMFACSRSTCVFRCWRRSIGSIRVGVRVGGIFPDVACLTSDDWRFID